jgi:hypothetical protein
MKAFISQEAHDAIHEWGSLYYVVDNPDLSGKFLTREGWVEPKKPPWGKFYFKDKHEIIKTLRKLKCQK